MPQEIQLKRSAIPGKVPTIYDLDVGEFGINTYDGRVFIKKKDNTGERIIELGVVSGSVASNASASMGAPLTFGFGILSNRTSYNAQLPTTLAVNTASITSLALFNTWTASINDFTASVIRDSASFDIRINSVSGSGASGSFIQNQYSSAQTANFWISGPARIDGEVLIFTTDQGNYKLQVSGGFFLSGALVNPDLPNNQTLNQFVVIDTGSGQFYYRSGSIGGGTSTDVSGYTLTASFHPFSQSIHNFTASVIRDSASFEGTIRFISASYVAFTQSYYITSASFDTRINNIHSSFTTYSQSINNWSQSIQTWTASINNFTASITGAVSSSVSGTLNYISKFTDRNKIGDSNIFESASMLYISESISVTGSGTFKSLSESLDRLVKVNAFGTLQTSSLGELAIVTTSSLNSNLAGYTLTSSFQPFSQSIKNWTASLHIWTASIQTWTSSINTWSASLNTGFIRNQFSSAQTASFWISGSSRIDGNFLISPGENSTFGLHFENGNTSVSGGYFQINPFNLGALGYENAFYLGNARNPNMTWYNAAGYMFDVHQGALSTPIIGYNAFISRSVEGISNCDNIGYKVEIKTLGSPSPSLYKNIGFYADITSTTGSQLAYSFYGESGSVYNKDGVLFGTLYHSGYKLTVSGGLYLTGSIINRDLPNNQTLNQFVMIDTSSGQFYYRSGSIGTGGTTDVSGYTLTSSFYAFSQSIHNWSSSINNFTASVIRDSASFESTIRFISASYVAFTQSYYRDSASYDTKFFKQSGNSFGATAVLGTLDSQSFELRTNNNKVFETSLTGKTTITNSDGESLLIVENSTSGYFGSGFHIPGRFYSPNMSAGQVSQYIIGRDSNTNNAYSIDFHYVNNQSTSNFIGFGFYANNDLFCLYATGNARFGGTAAVDPTYKLHVEGEQYIKDKLRINSSNHGSIALQVSGGFLLSGSLFNAGMPNNQTLNQFVMYDTGSNQFFYRSGSMGGAVEGLQETLDAGSTLTSNEVIFVGTNVLGVTGTGASAMFDCSHTAGAGQAILGRNSDIGVGVEGWGVQNVGVASRRTTSSGTNDVVAVFNTFRFTDASPANGLGSSIDMYNEVSDNSGVVSNQIISRWRIIDVSTRSSEFLLTGYDNAVQRDILKISGSGDAHLYSKLYLSQSLIENKSTGSFNSGSYVIYNVLTSSYEALFMDYVVTSGSNRRAGTLSATWMNTTTSFIENSTNDIGNTQGVSFICGITGSNTSVVAIISGSDGWRLKTLFKVI